eukprot:m.213811 g.213811  ORF g.213811 m.213811 type:complete len:417 (-) comp18613_c0_seq2:428-1678(-)
MADISDPVLRETIQDVRDDFTDTDWCALTYEGKTKLVVSGTGDGGHSELMSHLQDDKAYFCLLRLIDGDRESRRVKFVFITFCGENVGGMARGRVGAHSPSVRGMFGQTHTDLRADNHKECAEPIIRKLLKVAGGADYDTGANAQGYKSSGSLRQKAMALYSEKEKEGNIKGVVYVTSALPNTTPVDLSGRPMVAPPSEAKKNTKDSVVDTKKYAGKGSAAVSGVKAGGVFDDDSAKTVVRSSSISVGKGKRPPPARKPSIKKPDPGKKPAPLTKKPSIKKPSKPAPAPKSEEKEAEPKEEEAPTEEPKTEPKAEEAPRRSSILDEPMSDDPEERARQRAERRKAKREEIERQAREEVAALKKKVLESKSDKAEKAEEEAAAAAAAAGVAVSVDVGVVAAGVPLGATTATFFFRPA